MKLFFVSKKKGVLLCACVLCALTVAFLNFDLEHGRFRSVAAEPAATREELRVRAVDYLVMREHFTKEDAETLVKLAEKYQVLENLKIPSE